jgi:type IV pilus assembly protein PilO
MIFEETAVLLPKDKEIPKLLTDISALGRSAGLEFLTFKPQADVPKDFYAEIPITINVRGPYHNIGFFFDQVSKLERIVSVSNVKMSTPKKDGNEMLLNSDCVLVTYRFTNVELPKDPKK